MKIRTRIEKLREAEARTLRRVLIARSVKGGLMKMFITRGGEGREGKKEDRNASYEKLRKGP